MNSNLVTVSGVLLGVAVGILLFRLARELYMGEQGERTWLAFAERLVVAAALLSSGVMILSLWGVSSHAVAVVIPRSGTIASLVLLAGYVPAILAHYRFIGGKGRTGQRENPEPIERIIVHCTSVVAVLVALLVLLS